MSDTSVHIFPIPQSTFDQEYDFFRDYSWRGLTDLESLNDRRPGQAVVEELPYHMDLGVRPGLGDETARHQEAYRAGVFIGTVLLRHRVRLLRNAGEDITLPTQASSVIDWSTLRASRFLLSPLIEGDGEFDPKPALHNLENAWDAQESLDRMGLDDIGIDGLEALPPDDWVTIGMGDVLAMYASRYKYGRALLKTVPLAAETQDSNTLIA